MSEELERARKAAIMNRVMKYVVVYGIPILLLFVGMQEDTLTGMGLMFMAYLFLSMLWAIIAKNTAYAKFIMLYKKELITNALGCGELYENMEFNYDCGMNPEVVSKTWFLSVNRFFSNCFLSGTYNGKSFFQADIRNVRGERGGYNLEYDGTLISIPTNLPDIIQTVIYHKDIDCSIYLHGDPYAVSNPEFAKMFKVQAVNKAQAALLLTDDFMNRLMAIQNRIPRKIALTITNGRMYILLPNKKSVLKPRLFGKYDESMRAAIIEELNNAKLFMDAF